MAEVGDLLLGRLSQWVGAAADNLNKVRRRRGEEGREEGQVGRKEVKWREDGGTEVWVDGWMEGVSQ